MIRVTASVVLHRPERVLYYLPEVNEHTKQYITDGLCPPALEKCCDEFGTYDDVGIFFLPPDIAQQIGHRYVVGIEYRKDDPRVKIPEGLPAVVLPACNIICKDVSYEYQLTEEVLEEIIAYVKRMKDSRDSDFSNIKDGLVAAFYSKGKLRIMSEVDIVGGRGRYLGSDPALYSKEELYHMAFRDSITNYYNWSWMWECLSCYYKYGISDYGFVHFDIKDFKMINELYNQTYIQYH